MNRTSSIKVAIIGGGCASITTAFELSRPEHDGRYDITVYQQGWRLGGKGASGRGRSGRVEEHGLHLWMGHYDNAFSLIRECYEELGRDPADCPIATWTDAFKPASYVGIADGETDGALRRLMAQFPTFDGLPGDPYTDSNPYTIQAYLSRAARLLYTLMQSAHAGSEGRQRPPEDARPVDGAEPPRPDPAELRLNVRRLLRYGQLGTLTGVLQGVHYLQWAFAAWPDVSSDLVGQLLDVIARAARRILDPILDTDTESRFLWEIVDLVLASLSGCVRFGLLTHPKGFDAVNDYDSREWLRLNGASERSLSCGFLRGMYDLAFAYENGDPTRPRMAAGEGLRGCFRMLFTYRKSLFWKMQAGMGDAVFAPLYEVLERRGVRFEFFHRLENVVLSDDTSDTPHVSKLQFDVQAHVAGGNRYQPLVDVQRLPCWPSEPDWGQLEEGPRLRGEGRAFESAWDRRYESRKDLLVTKDFDFVVLGLSVGAVPHTCRELVQRDARWRAMVENAASVSTQCFQLWMKDDLPDLGWREPSPTVSGFAQPFSTWADMSHLVAAEDWSTPPRTVAYFCDVLPDECSPDPGASDVLAAQRERVRRHAITFLNRDVVRLWPKAHRRPGRFRWDLLAAPDDDPRREATGESRFASQFWVANVNPTDRYVLSLPGTIHHRISPLEETYDNLTVAGDWTDCGLNVGCVEAAVMSGRLAAHALSLRPRLEDIFGYDSP